jgi:UDP-N-acetylglucosamine---dolichyl-phosphate N-acetylglucosaminyltransferase
MKKKLCLVLPAFNEAKVIGGVIDNLNLELLKLKKIQKEVVVVDDGSSDQTGDVAKKKGAVVLKHVINRGLGGALTTGLEYAKRKNSDVVLTMDADGQHDPKDIKKVIGPILSGQADIVIGTRNVAKMPIDRKILTLLSSLLTFVFFGVYAKDTQSGLRAFNKKALNKIKIKTQRMEVSSEIFYEIKRSNLSFKQVPIRVIYTAYSREKGQQNLNAVKILLKLVLRLFR